MIYSQTKRCRFWLPHKWGDWELQDGGETKMTLHYGFGVIDRPHTFSIPYPPYLRRICARCKRHEVKVEEST